jgi:dienelactone hydrolase
MSTRSRASLDDVQPPALGYIPWVGLVFLVLIWLSPAAARATLVNPVAQAQNLLVSQEREAQFDTPSMIAAVASATAKYQLQLQEIPLKDPGRSPQPNPCTTIVACPIDPRLQDFASQGGIVDPVLYTNRAGATISGHLWATVAGPAKRPGIVIINGSIVGNEEFYWYAAQALARAGFVVMTFDPQGEGLSDQFGQAPDQDEEAFAGTPVLGPQLGGNGLAFYDGGEDALDFLLSTPSSPYIPVPSRTTGTSHAAKQRERVAAGLDSSYDPLWEMLDRNEIGIAGHSYGAEAASYLAQEDPRIKAVVAWDNLCLPVQPSPTEALAIATDPLNLQNAGLFRLPPDCFGAPPGPAPKITKPALGISSDYLLAPEPYLNTPDPQGKEVASLTYSKAGVDSGEIVIRGGTHYEFNDTPLGVIPASLRGIDLTTWYTVAWFKKYLQHDPNADAMLLTTRWRDDTLGGAVDPSHDPNLFSYLYLSRLDIHLSGGGIFDCENLRQGCPGQTTPSADCGPPSYSMVAVDTGTTPGDTCAPPATPTCALPSGRLRGLTLGPVSLGMTRAQARRRFLRSSTRGHPYMDFFCLTGSGIRAGYPSPKLLHRLAAGQRTRLRGRIVLALTANRYYTLHGVSVGTRLTSVARQLHTSTGYRIGLNEWYLLPNGPSNGVLKVRHGIIQEVGIANQHLTSTPRNARRFLASFS